MNGITGGPPGGSGLDVKRYNDLRGTNIFKLKLLKDKDKLDQDDGLRSFSITFKQYDTLTGAQSDMSIDVNHHELVRQRAQLAQAVANLSTQLQCLDNLIADLVAEAQK